MRAESKKSKGRRECCLKEIGHVLVQVDFTVKRRVSLSETRRQTGSFGRNDRIFKTWEERILKSEKNNEALERRQ